ncbi:MAG TPA: hypothetical protein VLN90_09310 [Thioalkalivibrio sp.]|nr:hypothetical protein [Thioalkalivibrio sp.]
MVGGLGIVGGGSRLLLEQGMDTSKGPDRVFAWPELFVLREGLL